MKGNSVVWKKCRIETEVRKIVVKKGVAMPQILEAKALEYIKKLERQRIIRKSESNWRKPVRFLEKPNGDVRLVVNIMALNDMGKNALCNTEYMRRIEIYLWFKLVLGN